MKNNFLRRESDKACKQIECKVGYMQIKPGRAHATAKLSTPWPGRKRPGGESRLPAAIVPPPGLGKIICMRKICKKFDARVNAGVFFCKTLP